MFPFWEQSWCAYEEALRERDARVRKLIPRSTGIEWVSPNLGAATFSMVNITRLSTGLRGVAPPASHTPIHF